MSFLDHDGGMSIPVDLAALGEALARHDTSYLLSGGAGRPHIAQVFPRLIGDTLVIDEPGKTARRRVVDHPEISLLCPPREAGGYSLIIDGAGTLDEDGALHVRPSHAVLHRAGAPTQDSDCGNDCRPLAD